MNVELLLKVKAAILAEPEKFRMDVWTCGTAHCIGGTACVLAGLEIKLELHPHLLTDGRTIAAAAADLLDIFNEGDCDDDDWDDTSYAGARLFDTGCWPEEFMDRYSMAEDDFAARAKIAAERIDHFIATDGRE